VRPETIQMIADAIDQAGAMAAFLFMAVGVATVSITLAALFVTLGLMRLWRRLTVGTWTAAIRVTERKAFQ
jgi:hypothetical protein